MHSEMLEHLGGWERGQKGKLHTEYLFNISNFAQVNAFSFFQISNMFQTFFK